MTVVTNIMDITTAGIHIDIIIIHLTSILNAIAIISCSCIVQLD